MLGFGVVLFGSLVICFGFGVVILIRLLLCFSSGIAVSKWSVKVPKRVF